MLGITKGAAFDVQAVCSGFVFAMTVADNFLKTGQFKRALVIGAETFSRILDWKDRSTCVLFGDGAGAVVLEANARPGLAIQVAHRVGLLPRLELIDAASPEARSGALRWQLIPQIAGQSIDSAASVSTAA